MESKSENLIRQIKHTIRHNKISYPDIMAGLTTDGVPKVSLTTVRRVCANGSENRASSFNYEETLIPIADAVKRIAGGNCNDACLHEIRDLLETNVRFITEQIEEKDKLIKRLIDRLDQKDEIIQQFIVDLKQKDSIIDKLMERII